MPFLSSVGWSQSQSMLHGMTSGLPEPSFAWTQLNLMFNPTSKELNPSRTCCTRKAHRAERELDLELLDAVTWPDYVWEWLRYLGVPPTHLLQNTASSEFHQGRKAWEAGQAASLPTFCFPLVPVDRPKARMWSPADLDC